MDLLFGSGSAFFNGTVAEAVQKARDQGDWPSLFFSRLLRFRVSLTCAELFLLVYTYEPNSASAEVLERDCWTDALLVEKLKEAVAIRLSTGSPEYGHFAQLYKAPSQPCVFFVSPSGDMLQTVTGDDISAGGLVHALQVLQTKSKVEAMRAQKMAEEEAAKQASEIKRREEAKAIQEARRLMEERRLAAEGARAKEAAEASRRHRDEVVAKVRMERQERSGAGGGANNRANSNDAIADAPVPATRVPSQPGRAKIKFVIGDKTISHTFSSTDTLAALRAFLRSEGYSGFTLETVFPRRTLLADQDGRTLESLSLTPACAIVVSLSPGATLRSASGAIPGSAISASASSPPVNFFSASSAAAPRAAGAAGSGRTTQHPNVDPTYVHPDDNNTFVNAIVNGATSVFVRLSQCWQRQPSARGSGASELAPARGAAPRTRPGGYEQLPLGN